MCMAPQERALASCGMGGGERERERGRERERERERTRFYIRVTSMCGVRGAHPSGGASDGLESATNSASRASSMPRAGSSWGPSGSNVGLCCTAASPCPQPTAAQSVWSCGSHPICLPACLPSDSCNRRPVAGCPGPAEGLSQAHQVLWQLRKACASARARATWMGGARERRWNPCGVSTGAAGEAGRMADGPRSPSTCRQPPDILVVAKH